MVQWLELMYCGYCSHASRCAVRQRFAVTDVAMWRVIPGPMMSVRDVRTSLHSATGVPSSCGLAALLRRMISAVMVANTSRQAAGISIGARTLPLACLTAGTRFCAMKPPMLPSELIAAIPAAARTPNRNFDGSVQKHGISRYRHGAPKHSATKRSVLVGRKTELRKNSTPSNAETSIAARARLPARSFDGSHASTIVASSHGMMLSKPLVVLLTPKPFTSVGSQ